VHIWSAACSSGEEPYSIAMTLLDKRPAGDWELWASDLSARVLAQARRGVYAQQRIDDLPASYLKRFCMRGTGKFEGKLRVSEEVRKRLHLFTHNLLHDARALGGFDVVFLRNVLIYFDTEKKNTLMARVLTTLNRGGLLFIGHAESLQGITHPLRRVERAVFEKTA
jgi:chemotaxis protein methyltransferase CheR